MSLLSIRLCVRKGTPGIRIGDCCKELKEQQRSLREGLEALDDQWLNVGEIRLI